MGACCCVPLLLVPFSLTTATLVVLFSNTTADDDIFSLYTLVSALIISAFPLAWAFYYCYYTKEYE